MKSYRKLLAAIFAACFFTLSAFAADEDAKSPLMILIDNSKPHIRVVALLALKSRVISVPISTALIKY